MKNFTKLFGIIALVALIGFSMAGCDIGGDNGDKGTPTTQTNYSLDGTWKSARGWQITIKGTSGTISSLGSPITPPSWEDAVNKNMVKIGDQFWRNITSTGNLTWSGQELIVQNYTSTPNVAIGTSWTNCTFTMSADGQTLNDGAWTRKQ
jgi:hypothetical protein